MAFPNSLINRTVAMASCGDGSRIGLTETSKAPPQNFIDGNAFASRITVYYDKVAAAKCPRNEKNSMCDAIGV